MSISTFVGRSWFARSLAAAAAILTLAASVRADVTPLADQPILVADVPANVLLTMSVEFPTAMNRAFKSGFSGSASTPYLGYYDPYKCYSYVSGGGGYFQPVSKTGTNYTCSGAWSGHFLNWATMQGADIFRWALTGGNRSVDVPVSFDDTSPSQIILNRAYAAAQGYFMYQFPDKTIVGKDIAYYTNPSDFGLASVTDYTRIYIRNGGLGRQFAVKSSYSALDDYCTGCTYFSARVEVCRDPDGKGTLLEGNCRKYTNAKGTKSVYKPVGLIQEYRDKMYFGAFGYLLLNDNNNYDANGVANQYKDGGVLRAMVQSVDKELTETGAFVTDPYNMLAAQGVTYSGTMNYINKFGEKSQSYKMWDPVSELYAEAIKYYKNLKPTASYVSGVDSKNRDDFPVFATWNDPATDAKYPKKGPLSCKKNYIVGIGDTNSNFDFNLSGSPYGFPADVDTNMAGKTAKDWTDQVGALEGISGLSGRSIYNGSFYIAGVAYYAHSNDLRSDLDGYQTVDTYWMDVMEVGYVSKNQYWLATKYGGYKKPSPTAPPGPFDPAADVWYDKTADGKPVRSIDGDPLPNNYFTADSPDAMTAGLRAAFQSIASGSGSGSGAALSSSQVDASTGGANTYQATYDATMWSGDVIASRVNKLTTDDSLDLTTLWSAAKILNTVGPSTRKIITLAPKDKTNAKPAVGDLFGTPFQWDGLSDAQKLSLSKTTGAPTGDEADGKRILNYLRGDRTYESTAAVSNLYRQRASVLGDIVDSKVVYMGKPSASYSESYNPGYTRFKSDKSTRMPLIFVGSNDGMLHAFDASNSSSGGREVFALVPYATFEGPDGTPDTSGLQALARKNYTHHYYVNATPEIRDVDFARTGARFDSFGPGATADWRTILVTGLGKGGRSFVAMDVTDITATNTESELAGRVLWEFTHPDMGFSFGRPLIAKTRRWGWVVILTGGYNNINGSKPGQGAVFVLNAKTGELLGSSPVYTGDDSGSISNPSGLAQVEGYTPSYQEYMLDYVYGGDLYGNLWRFDFSDKEADLPYFTQVAHFAVGSKGQPITVAPKIEYSADDLKRYIFVGTGRLLDSEDQGNNQQQSIYAIRDGTKSRAFGAKSYQVPFPSGGAFPISRSNLVQVTDLIEGAKLDTTKPMGWYYDLTGVNAGVTERIVLNLQANDGVVTWVGSIMNDDPCNASGNAVVYAVHYGNAQSVLYKLESGLYKQIEMTDPIIGGLADTTLVRVGSSIRVLGTDVKGKSSLYGSTVSESGEPRVVNWRVIRDQ